VLDVPAEFETAIAAALGDQIDTVLLAGETSVEEALALLETNSAGRAALLPQDWLSAGKTLAAPADETCLGVANALISVPGYARPAADLLLGQTLVVRDRGAARRLLKETGAQRVVTLRGEVFRADGLVLAGKESHAAALSRPRQKRELQRSLAALHADLAALDQTIVQLAADQALALRQVGSAEVSSKDAAQHLGEARTAAQAAALAAESAKRQTEWQDAQKRTLQEESSQSDEQLSRLSGALDQSDRELSEAHDAIRLVSVRLAALDVQDFVDQVTYWNTRAQVAEGTLGEARKRLDERIQAAERLEAEGVTLERRIAEIEDWLIKLEDEKSQLVEIESGLNGRLAELRARMDPAESKLAAAEKREAELQVQETSAQGALQVVERQNSQAQLELARRQESVENLRRRIEDDFGLVQFDYEVPMEGAVPLPLGDLVETLPMMTSLAPELEQNLAQQKSQLRRMGAINMEARQEFEDTLERFNDMSAQIEDLRGAEADLHEVIAELDELTRAEFTRTFEAVAVHFKEIFVRLFGGGSASLVLTEPENLTETGIDIEARLPGKREQGLASLSGGERSLTAIALVFALLRVSPTPLCVMDEVDAMLDEANVGRFRDLLAELSRETQFIIITHNRSTVQAADVIYGVTMGRDSASQVISLKLDEITEEMLER